MHSEFESVPLDRIRYSVVWEHSATLLAALRPGPTDEALVVTSAGCNVLNTLLLTPARRVTALDLNPTQNALLHLKTHLLQHALPGALRALLGLEGPHAVAAAWRRISPQLPAALRATWGPVLDQHPGGLLTAGQLESYLLGFLPTLAPAGQRHLRALLACPTVAAQHAYFERHLHGTDFQTQFEAYFSDASLSRGRDPRLFRYAGAPGGPVFYERLRQQAASERLADNFFFRFFFFGPAGLPEALLPPCYQARNVARLRAQLPRLRTHTGEAVEYLLSPAGRTVTCASLSNIFEYVSPAEFAATNQALAQRGNLRFVYWNLLQPQGDQLPTRLPQPLPPSPGACFYLPDARLLAHPPAVTRAETRPAAAKLTPAAYPGLKAA